MSSTIRITLMATLFAALGTSAAAVQIDWVGPTGNYSDFSKWSKPISGGPCNSMFIGYEVNVPAGGKTVNEDVASCTVNTFTFEDGNNLTLSPGSAFTVTGQATIGNDSKITLSPGTEFKVTGQVSLAGIIDGIGGNFTPLGPAMFAGERARAYATAGSQIRIGAAAYTSLGLRYDDGCNPPWCGPATWTWNLFTASDADSLLDLSSLATIDAGFPATNDVNRQEIACSSGAVIDLSGVRSIRTPASANDWIRFSLTGAASQLRLGALSTLTSAGRGRTLFQLRGGASLDLSALATVNDAEFDCADNGALDLSGVRTITGPVNAADWISFTASSGCTIKLDSLQKITSAGAGPVKFAISGGSKLETTAPVIVSAITDFTVGSDSQLRFGGGQLGGNGSKIDLQSATSSLLVGGDLSLEDKSLFLLAPGSIAELEGSLFFKQVVKTVADRAKVKMSQATVKLTGSFPKVQILEAAGVDVLPQLPADDNFGIGKLVLAGDEHGNPSLAAVVDRFNNGQRDPSQTCSSTEVLYLFGLPDGQGGRSDGLMLENGSTLFLDDAVHVYAWSNEAAAAGGNPVVLLNEILGSDTMVPYSGGFLAHDLSDRDGDGVSDLADNCPDTPNGADLGALRQADADCNAKGDACECGDFNKDGTVNTIDARAIQKWVVAPGQEPPMFCDTNGDGRCNTIDARRIQRKVVGELDPDELLCRPYYPCPRFGGNCLP